MGIYAIYCYTVGAMAFVLFLVGLLAREMPWALGFLMISLFCFNAGDTADD